MIEISGAFEFNNIVKGVPHAHVLTRMWSNTVEVPVGVDFTMDGPPHEDPPEGSVWLGAWEPFAASVVERRRWPWSPIVRVYTCWWRRRIGAPRAGEAS